MSVNASTQVSVAKRGARCCCRAAPKENGPWKPEAGDVIILLGGKTGRDSVGGATGSSKVQTVESVETAGAEVQKGNAIEERRFNVFSVMVVTRQIKKSNDFSAGGVCVAIGEFVDGLEIDLDKVPLKYQGLNGTEIAISESQSGWRCSSSRRCRRLRCSIT